MSTDILTVKLGQRSYDIHISSGLLARAGEIIKSFVPESRALVVSDETVANLFHAPLAASLEAAGVQHRLLTVPPGETSKSFSILASLLDQALDTHPDRHTLILALGGGVVGDLAGFAASVLLRGVPFIQIPTTLLSQVDSSVGGKTGINTHHGKNLVGSFYQPKAVIIDVETLSSLPERELRSGYAEVVKYGVLGKENFFRWLEKNGRELLAGDVKLRQEAIYRSCAAKAEIVAQDEREAGVRALLNLGHTFAHALEAETGYATVTHGEAVAAGMVLAFRLSRKLGHCTEQDVAAVEQHITRAGLPTTFKGFRVKPEALLEHMYHDKKAQAGALTFVLARGVGQAFVAKNVPTDAVLQVLEENC